GSAQANQAYKLYELLSKDYHVNIIVTENAEYFVKFPEDANVFKKKYNGEKYEIGEEANHIAFRTNVDLNVVYPASSNYIAKIAHGIMDNLATMIYSFSCTRIPTLLYPAYHALLSDNPYISRNIEMITEINHLTKVMNPKFGVFPDGEMGAGMLIKPLDVKATIDKMLQKKLLLNK